MSLILVLKLLHILAAFLLVAGLLGRGVAFAQVRKAQEPRAQFALLRLSEQLERRMVRPGSEAVILFGLLTGWAQGAPLFGFLQGSSVNWLVLSLALYLLTVPLVFGVLLPRSKRRLQALAEAESQGATTPALADSLDDPVVLRTRNVELALVLLIIVLMVLKPV